MYLTNITHTDDMFVNNLQKPAAKENIGLKRKKNIDLIKHSLFVK